MKVAVIHTEVLKGLNFLNSSPAVVLIRYFTTYSPNFYCEEARRSGNSKIA